MHSVQNLLNIRHEFANEITVSTIFALNQEYSGQIELTPRLQGAVSIRKTVLPGMAIPMLKIRRPNGRLIFNIGIAIPR